jgi:SAM-dependent methyltransferase
VEREDWDRRWEERGFHCSDDPVGVLAEELEPLAPGRALDLGCGAGRAALWLADRGWNVTAVDFSEVALSIARGHNADIDWVLADVREYEPERAAFDLVLVLYMHFPAAERRTLLDRSTAALAEGGTLVVLGHDVENIGTGAPGPSNPDLLYTPEGVAGELAGLDIARAERLMRPAGEATAVDTLVVARNG